RCSTSFRYWSIRRSTACLRCRAFTSSPRRYRVSASPTSRLGRGGGFATSADLMAELMHDVLHYSRYGPRGSVVGGDMVSLRALRHREQVIGAHLTGMIGTAGAEPPFTPAEQAFIDAGAATLPERAYARLQMSKPQTLAHALNDSPAGLAAWI